MVTKEEVELDWDEENLPTTLKSIPIALLVRKEPQELDQLESATERFSATLERDGWLRLRLEDFGVDVAVREFLIPPYALSWLRSVAEKACLEDVSQSESWNLDPGLFVEK